MDIDTRSFAARVENLAAANDFVEACAGRSALDEKVKFALLLALEEAFVNVCSYAYAEDGGQVELTCETGPGSFVLCIVDSGKPFDSLALPEPDMTSDVMDRHVGGLGIHFIRQLTESVTYQRDGGRNILRMAFRTESR